MTLRIRVGSRTATPWRLFRNFALLLLLFLAIPFLTQLFAGGGWHLW